MQDEPEQDMWNRLGLLFDGLPREERAGQEEETDG